MTENTDTDATESSILNYRHWFSPSNTTLSIFLTLLIAVQPVLAQSGSSKVGDVFCGTKLATGITIIGSLVGGLGLTLGTIAIAVSGYKFMNAKTGDQKKEAKENLIYSFGGTGVVVLAVLGPRLINKIIDPLGVTFSKCVMPF